MFYTKYIQNEQHYKDVLSKAEKVKESLWIGTADIKDLYFGNKPFLEVIAGLLKREFCSHKQRNIMEEILERIPQLENRIYIIGGPRRQALEEALTLILGILDKHYLCTEFFCLKDSPETIQNLFNEISAAKGLGRGGYVSFTTIKNGNVEAINNRIGASYSRRFVRLTFIDSLEAMHNRGEKFDREKVLNSLSKCNPVIVVSDEIAPTGSDGGQYESNGTTFSLTIK